MPEIMKQLKWRYMLLGAIVAIVGLCFLLFASSAAAITIIIGILLMLMGLAIGALSIIQRKRDFIFWIRLSFAIILLICGALVAIFNEKAFGVLVSAVCFLIIIDSSFKLQTSISSKKYSVECWWIMLAISASVILSAFLIARIAPGSIKATAIWLGITVILDSAANFISGFFKTRCRAAEKAEIYYEVYEDIQNNDAE